MHYLTVMHRDPPKPPVKRNMCTQRQRGDNGPRSYSKIVLVDVTMEGSNKEPLRCYAIIDEQSGNCFGAPELATYFGVKGPSSTYLLNTLAGNSSKTECSTAIEGIHISGLKVKGVLEPNTIELPTVITNPFIPADATKEVATPEAVRSLPHVRHLAHHFAEFDERASVLLLIGRESGHSMITRLSLIHI